MLFNISSSIFSNPDLVHYILILVPFILLFIVSSYLLGFERNIDSRHPLEVVDGTLGHIGIPISFFQNRYDWAAENLKKHGVFSFSLTGRRVIIIDHTSENLDIFFGSKALSLDEGYGIVLGPQPYHKPGAPSFSDKFHRRIHSFLKREKLTTILPTLIEVVNLKLDEFGDDGIADPFQSSSIYGLIYQVTMFLLGPREIATNPILLSKSLACVETIEASVTSSYALFPWLPLPAYLKRMYAGFKFYFLVRGLVADRIKNEVEVSDPLQSMIDDGDSVQHMVTVILAGLFAGIINTGINGAYILAYLGNSPSDKLRALEEIKSIAAKYSNDTSLPLCQQLESVPVDAWENEFHYLDSCLKESIRMNLLGLAWRKNIRGKEIEVEGKIVPDGAYIATSFSAPHMDPKNYDSPKQFNPSRYDSKLETENKYSFVGWGSGNHACIGKKFAKLEIFLVLAFYLARFDFITTNEKGNEIELPETDLNLHNVKKGKGIFLKYRTRSLE